MPTPILPTIHSPADIKVLEEAQLPQLAQEVREELIRVLSDETRVPWADTSGRISAWSN